MRLLLYLQLDLAPVQLQEAVAVVDPDGRCEAQVEPSLVVPQHQRRLPHRAVPNHQYPDEQRGGLRGAPRWSETIHDEGGSQKPAAGVD